MTPDLGSDYETRYILEQFTEVVSLKTSAKYACCRNHSTHPVTVFFERLNRVDADWNCEPTTVDRAHNLTLSRCVRLLARSGSDCSEF